MAGIAEALEGVLARPGALLGAEAACFGGALGTDPGAAERALAEHLAAFRAGEDPDPLANPVLRLALRIGQMLDRDELTDAGVEQLVQRLTLRGFAWRGERLRRYLGGLQPGVDAER